MQQTGGKGGGFPFTLLLSILAVLDLGFRGATRCEGKDGMVIGLNIFIGLLVGCAVAFIATSIIYPSLGVSGENMYFTFEPSQSKCRVINNKFKCIKRRKV